MERTAFLVAPALLTALTLVFAPNVFATHIVWDRIDLEIACDVAGVETCRLEAGHIVFSDPLGQ